MRFIVPAQTILLLVFLFQAACANDTQHGQAHPDGAIGAFGILIRGQYMSVSSDKPVATRDHQQFELDLNLPISAGFSLSGGYRIEPNDTLFHSAGLGLTFYTKPGDHGISSANPDGPVSAPVVSIAAYARFKDDRSQNNRLRISGLLLLPTTAHLTFGAGMNYYDVDDPLIIDEYYGLLAWFIKRYHPDRLYINPDGLPGYPVFRLMGGGNSEGLFGRLEMVVPMSPRYSLSVWARGEKISDSAILKLGLGAGISLYPGNN